VVDRVTRGETVDITRAGKRVAQLRPMPTPGKSAAALLAAWSRLPRLDAESFERDIAEVLDASL
jgi:antitoxin (DNA-binding transcriptional repressor) of toxin-antitoxin stability system